MSPPLTNLQKRHLRGMAHQLKPVVMVGQHGLRDAVVDEIELALTAHELVKIKIAADRDARDESAAQILARTGAVAIQSIGQMRVIFRRNAEQPRIALPGGPCG